jgi:hypothetical protein
MTLKYRCFTRGDFLLGKILILIQFILPIYSYAYTDPKVGGTVNLPKALEKSLKPQGILFVFAKKAGPDSGPNDHQPPLAVIKISAPKFPQAFVITPKNVMIPGTPFEGPFHVIARYAPNGDAMSSPDSLEGIDPKFPVADLGNKNLQIQLQAKAK